MSTEFEVKVVTAPEIYQGNSDNYIVYLAGGITNCRDWQSMLVNKILGLVKFEEFRPFKYGRLILANPRQEHFDMSDSYAAEKQIKWEFDLLNRMHTFAMYFDGPTESDQPICFYELGRYLMVLQKYHMSGNKRAIIAVNDEFKRKQDVIIQTRLATDDQYFPIDIIKNESFDNDMTNFAMRILQSCRVDTF